MSFLFKISRIFKRKFSLRLNTKKTEKLGIYLKAEDPTQKTQKPQETTNF